MANLFKADLGTLGPALGQLSAAGVTDEMWERIGRSDGEYARVIFEAIMAKMSGASDEPVDTITFSADATAEQLIADAKAAFEKEGIPFTYFNDDAILIIRRDLEIVKGKKLQVLMHSFGRYWTTQEGRNFQRGQGHDGNAAAYLAWVTKTKRMGWSVSIANTDDRLFPRGGCLCAPCFDRDESHRKFNLLGVRGKWFDGRVLVAFRAI